MKQTIKLPTEVVEFLKETGTVCTEYEGSTFYYLPFFIEHSENGKYNLMRFDNLPKGIQELFLEQEDFKNNRIIENTVANFDEFVSQQCEKIIQILSVKGKEYRRNNNAFHNFERAAAMQNITREKAAYNFMAKHIVSLMDIMDDLDKGVIPSQEVIDEKMGDIEVYSILIHAMLRERVKQLD